MADGTIFGDVMQFAPHNSDAEQAVLGAILLRNDVLWRVDEIIEPFHFYDPLLGEVFECARRVIYAQGAANSVTLLRFLEGSPNLGRLSPADFLKRLMMSTPGIVDAHHYAMAVRDAWVRREIFAVCTQAAERCSRPGDRATHEIIDELEDGLLRVSQGIREDEPCKDAGVAVREAIEAARLAAERGNGLSGASWGYRALDRMTGGLMAGGLYLIGARPAMGKTALGLGIAARAAAAGTPTYYWSGEMKEVQLGARMAAAAAHLSTLSVFTGRRYDVPEHAETGVRQPLEGYQWKDLEEAGRDAARLPLWFDSHARITVAKVRSRARRLARSRKGLGLIVLDYAGLMSSGSAYEDRSSYERITKISGQVKQLALELNVPIILLAQLNRQSEARDDKRPGMADLRDAGALEQDADVVMLIHREHYYLKKQMDAGLSRKDKESGEDFANRVSDLANRTKQAEGKADLLIQKIRNGADGVCHLQFRNETTWFRDTSEDERSPAWVVTASEGDVT